MEQKSTVSCEATGKGYLTVHMPIPRPLRVDFHWVPGADPGTFNGSPWLVHRFLAQLGDACLSASSTTRTTSTVSARFSGRLLDPYLDGDLSLPDDYELFCQDLEVIQNLNSFAECHAAALSLVPASSQPPVAPQLPVVRQYLAGSRRPWHSIWVLPSGLSQTFWLSLLFLSPDSELKNPLPEQRLAKEGNPGPTEPPALSTSTCSTSPVLVGPASSQSTEMVLKPVLVLSESA